jgi:hypothetical protein
MSGLSQNGVCEAAGEDDIKLKTAFEAEIQAKLSKIAYSHLIFNPFKKLASIVRHCKEVFNAVHFVNHLNLNIKELVSNIVASKKVMLP